MTDDFIAAGNPLTVLIYRDGDEPWKLYEVSRDAGFISWSYHQLKNNDAYEVMTVVLSAWEQMNPRKGEYYRGTHGR